MNAVIGAESQEDRAGDGAEEVQRAEEEVGEAQGPNRAHGERNPDQENGPFFPKMKDEIGDRS